MLKLAKIPDRTPIRITISASAALNRDLQDYAAVYRATYGEEASIGDLIPFMLESFLKSDQAFAKAKREGVAKPAARALRPPASARLAHEAAATTFTNQPEQEN